MARISLPAFEHALRDADDLFERLAFAVDDLGHAVAQMAVVVDVRIGHVLEGQVLQPVERRLDAGLAGADGFGGVW